MSQSVDTLSRLSECIISSPRHCHRGTHHSREQVAAQCHECDDENDGGEGTIDIEQICKGTAGGTRGRQVRVQGAEQIQACPRVSNRAHKLQLPTTLQRWLNDERRRQLRRPRRRRQALHLLQRNLAKSALPILHQTRLHLAKLHHPYIQRCPVNPSVTALSVSGLCRMRSEQSSRRQSNYSKQK